jgi:hypothetical protein
VVIAGEQEAVKKVGENILLIRPVLLLQLADCLLQMTDALLMI